jgi:CheY-like chemotaxis protein
MRLLIAEDNEGDVLLLRESLKSAGLAFEAEVASDGESALALIEQAAGRNAQPLDGMILDMNLLTHSGIEILNRVRAIPSLAALSVVILTSSDSPADRRDAEELGAAAYIRKAIDLDEVMRIGQQIAGVLTQSQQSALTPR